MPAVVYPARRLPPVHPRLCGEHDLASNASPLLFPVHPRLCGEHMPFMFSPTIVAVHPRLCGEHALSSALAVVTRFIPACAGNTLRTRHQQRPDAGSSPPVRGTPTAALPGNAVEPVHPRLCGEHRVSLRFIPACAGNTGLADLRNASSGSSPPVRGTQVPRPP